ncbi:ORFL73C [Human betaherpesvirus 5]|nr:ORFL73C [Human betaherpesvirus 5]QHX40381.1 ORFL73C [Human betaherpesvirus 5]
MSLSQKENSSPSAADGSPGATGLVLLLLLLVVRLLLPPLLLLSSPPPPAPFSGSEGTLGGRETLGDLPALGVAGEPRGAPAAICGCRRDDDRFFSLGFLAAPVPPVSRTSSKDDGASEETL